MTSARDGTGTGETELFGGTGGMDGNGFFFPGERQMVKQEFMYKLDRFVEVQFLCHNISHAIETRRSIAENRIFPLLRGCKQCLFKLC